VHLAAFLPQYNPKLLHVIPTNGTVWGLTVCGEELFILQGDQHQVDVYNNSSFAWTRALNIPGSKYLMAMVACPHNKCLYISDSGQNVIIRYDPQLNSTITQWPVSGTCEALSVTRSYNLLVTHYKTKLIQEFNTDGRLIRAIDLDSSIDNPWHCVELSNGQFAVSCDRGGKQGRLCIVNNRGLLMNSYGGLGGIGGIAVRHIQGPRHLAVDKHDYVMFADFHTSCVGLYAPKLDSVGFVEIPGHKLRGPYHLHLHEQGHRLYIGEYKGGRLFVVEADMTRMRDTNLDMSNMDLDASSKRGMKQQLNLTLILT